MGILSCPLCGVAYLAPGVRACVHTDAEDWEIYRLEQEAEKLAGIRGAFLASLPPRYRAYLKGVPAELRARNEAVFRAMDEASEGALIYLHGVGGAGKTHMAVLATARLMSRWGLSGLYVNEEDYFEAVEASYGGGPAAPDLSLPQVLLYDDAGKKPPSANAARHLYRMLERRWRAEKATIITANRPAAAIAAALAANDGEASSLAGRLLSGYDFAVQPRPGLHGRAGSAL